MAPRSPSPARTLAAVAGLLTAAGLLSGCAPTVDLDPAPHANDPGCAEVVVRLPDRVAGFDERTTDAQATGAWGDPAAVLLRCGVPVPGPTTLPCVTVNGVDWIEDSSKAPDSYRFVTFGRDPATAVIIDHARASNSTVLVDVGKAVAVVPATEHCLGPGDTFSTPSP